VLLLHTAAAAAAAAARRATLQDCATDCVLRARAGRWTSGRGGGRAAGDGGAHSTPAPPTTHHRAPVERFPGARGDRCTPAPTTFDVNARRTDHLSGLSARREYSTAAATETSRLSTWTVTRPPSLHVIFLSTCEYQLLFFRFIFVFFSHGVFVYETQFSFFITKISTFEHFKCSVVFWFFIALIENNLDKKYSAQLAGPRPIMRCGLAHRSIG